MSLLGEQRIRTLIEGALAACKEADQAEVLLSTSDEALTRFANNTIHQNVAERNSSLHVRAVIGKRIGVARANSLEAQAIREAAESACTIARYSEENPEFVTLPAPSGAVAAIKEAFSEDTAAATPERRARAVQAIISRAEADKLIAAGAFSTMAEEVAAANSLGVFAYQPSTSAEATLVVMGDSSSGYADRAATDVSTIDAEGMAAEACGRATRSAQPRDLDPGTYPVVLEPYAVAEMLDYLAYVGFGATALQEGRSFMAEKMGQRVAAEAVGIYDDGLDPRCFPMPFDFEGVPRRRVALIEQGIARGVVYDSFTASRGNVSNTGHALPAPNSMGPMPGHLHIEPGQATLQELVAGLDRGVWVSRFHYVNVIQPLETIITGMTRDGAWWVEGGEVRYAIKNLRFSQSVLDALASTEAIGRELKLQRGWFGGSLVPALRLGRFAFTGKTEF
ncbi:MAG TPA: TldD/PmbA family protein [Chloroflexota bacterium]|nr:TldD/PmbA family protein [Chloroflexota bacterium]